MAPACAFDDGRGYAHLERFTVTGDLDGPASVTTDLGYEIAIEQASIKVGQLELQEVITSGSGAGGTFDPANPPPGYGLCHADHCHHESGELHSYDEIRTALASGGAKTAHTIVSGTVGTVNLLGGDPREPESWTPSAELPAASLDRVRVELRRLKIVGTVRGGPARTGLGSELRELSIDVALDGSLAAEDSFGAIADDGYSGVRGGVTLVVPGDLLGGIEWSQGRAGDQVLVTDGEIADALAEKMAAARVEAEVEVESIE
jgi:hypothetical protein